VKYNLNHNKILLHSHQTGKNDIWLAPRALTSIHSFPCISTGHTNGCTILGTQPGINQYTRVCTYCMPSKCTARYVSREKSGTNTWMFLAALFRITSGYKQPKFSASVE
jgi:hypothetical protein